MNGPAATASPTPVCRPSTCCPCRCSNCRTTATPGASTPPSWSSARCRTSRRSAPAGGRRSHPRTGAALADAIADARPATMTVRLQRADGRPAWVELHLAPLPRAGRLLALLHDVTASREREMQAQSEIDRFRLVADNVPVAIAYYESEGNTCLYANRRYAQTFGLDERTIVGLSTPQVIGVEGRARDQPHVDRAIADHHTACYEPPVDRRGWPAAVDRGLPGAAQSARPASAVGAFVLINDITRHARRRPRSARARSGWQVHAGQRRRHRLPQGRADHRCQSAAAGAAGVFR